jgi:hypothetical protein
MYSRPISLQPVEPLQIRCSTAVYRVALNHQEPRKKATCRFLHLSAILCNPLQNSQVPPLGLEESPKPSGNTGVSENHCADPCAQFSNSEQLAAIISALDRNELEQRLLDLLKEIQPDTNE